MAQQCVGETTGRTGWINCIGWTGPTGRIGGKTNFAIFFAKGLKLDKWTCLPNMVSLAQWEPIGHDYYSYTLKIRANSTSSPTQKFQVLQTRHPKYKDLVRDRVIKREEEGSGKSSFYYFLPKERGRKDGKL